MQVNGLSKGRKDSESQRIRIKKEHKHSNKEHIVDRGHVSMSHNKVVYEPNPMPESNETSSSKIWWTKSGTS